MKLGVTATKQEFCSFVLQFWSNLLCLNDIEHSSTDLDTLVYIYIYVCMYVCMYVCIRYYVIYCILHDDKCNNTFEVWFYTIMHNKG